MLSSSATSQIEFGIKGGLNFNYANNETYLIEGWKKCSICPLDSQYFNIFDKKTGHFFGLYSKIKFGRFYIHPEFIYAKINSQYDLTYTWNLVGEIINEFTENRIQIPVTVGIGLLQGKLNFFGGPAFNFISDIYFTENNETQSIADLYEKSLISLQYGVSLDLGKIGFDFTINRGFGEKEIVFVEKVFAGNKNQIVRTKGMMTMVSAKYRF
ncbi:MAG: hypothetical protein VXZ50_02920 [Bacteroidota bacterium]|nr:hypothetical protein [Bacteroidota bacterium]MEE2604924.1 hypothetical protein [Bacteroidota bacterium]